MVPRVPLEHGLELTVILRFFFSFSYTSRCTVIDVFIFLVRAFSRIIFVIELIITLIDRNAL